MQTYLALNKIIPSLATQDIVNNENWKHVEENIPCTE
jgi:hypothetical protein